MTPSSPRKSVAPAGRKHSRRLLLRAIGGVLGFGWVASRAARAESADMGQFHIIVNSENRASSAPREFVEGAFLKKISRWADGETIRAVDQGPRSRVRQVFSESVLKRPVAAVRSYWLQRVFTGRETPPPELDSDEAVIHYVAKYRGAVGYVSKDAPLGNTRVISVR